MNRFAGYLVVLSIFVLAAGGPVYAGAHGGGGDTEVNAMIDELRSQIETRREELVEANLTLTSEQKQDFWPLYEKYHAERRELVDKRVQLLTQFRDDRIGITAKQAEDILKEAIKIEKALVDLKDKYRKDFVKVLLPRGALRYYQIENKIDATINFDLAKVVPLQPK
jgi:Spy/CpxP family protein refolding chaperone